MFLYGASQSTEAFRSAFDANFRDKMSRFAQSRPRAIILGAVLSIVAQGSTVSTSLAISFVDVGMLTLAGSVAVMMGASIGGTFVTLLISLDIVSYSPMFFAVSFIMTRFGHGWTERAGNVFHSLSLILIGMFLMKLGVSPMQENQAVREAIAAFAQEPFAMFLAAMLGTAVLQSSASVMAIFVTVAASGAIPLGAVFPVVLGAHLGGTFTTLLAAAGGRRNARLLGVATFLYKVAGVAAFAPLVPMFNIFLTRHGLSIPSNIVLAQMSLALFNAAIFYPWPQILIRGGLFALRHMRGRALGTPLYLDDNLVEIPALAVGLLSKEMIRLTNYIEALLQMQLYPEKDGDELRKLLPGGIDELTEACERYMSAIHPPSLADDFNTMREYRKISFAMLSLREVSLTMRSLRKLIEAHGLDNLADEMGRLDWYKISTFLMETVRNAFHAFSLGDTDLALRTIGKEEEFEKLSLLLRSRLLSKGAGQRESTELADFITASGRFLLAALEVARGDVFVKSTLPDAENQGSE
jgi:Na/Pi-cotransporter